MENQRRNFFDTRIIIALFIIVVGVLLLLENLHYIGDINIWEWWPLILILIGIGQIMQPKQGRQSLSGVILIVIGALILGSNLEIIYFDWSLLWPIILILIGVMILRHTFWGRKGPIDDVNFINLSFVLGGGDHNYNSKQLSGGRLTAIMGGGKIDLRDADMEGNSMVIDTFAFWGGLEIIVPKSWHVNIQGAPILGGMENKTVGAVNESGQETPQSGKTLIIKGAAVMGGVEVKN